MKNLKILGLALVAAFAMSAVVASAASAAEGEFHAESSPTVLTGTQEGSGDVFHTDGGNVTCSSASYVGEAVGTATTEAEVEPTYTSCTAFGFINTPIDSIGCKLRFTFPRIIEIRCTIGHFIAITAPGCTVTIGEQTPTGGSATFTNIGTGTTRELTIDVSLTGIHYIEDNNGGGCVGPTGTTKTNGTYTGHAILTGENASKVHHGIWVE